jgi:hypothetical protein
MNWKDDPKNANALRWFKDHVPAVQEFNNAGDPDQNLTFIRFRKPDTFTYACDFLLVGGRLFVTGDLGAAVYAWGRLLDLQWLAGLDLDYFAEKCEASENGRGHREWDSREVTEHLHELTQLKGPKRQEARRCAEEGKYEWQRFCYENNIDAGDWGSVVSIRCRSHLIALKLCHELVTAAGKSSAAAEVTP